MTQALKPTPEVVDIKTGVTDAKAVAKELSKVLADTYNLTIKTHAVHWNVEGPMFYAVHNLTEGQYGELFAAADVIAERIRALGHLTAMSPKELLKGSVVTDIGDVADAITLCNSLAEDHSKVAKRLHDVIEKAGKAGDPVTEDLATARAAVHEKAAWMLRALATT
ncbi:Dps family protein [Pacificibacter marinus]|uniref:DNA protection during starvation protein 1 n=1 Tax=Pacificibacter marinus TaxID=658057 RepID=A0A1Y5RK58_9RHOB|nr:DNA starvation/stationary phase protection protein [Pacificibacter marinus]SEK20505.1 starvation-inducible DNA-binding protein [Pacificibacter marinus]SLN16726.1 DNA protection during starvation protein 1 [Pacificibacter marinus]